ncbi:MAG: TonB-dependent receptor, partial [Spirochaetia bacterium]|nr:TonB-dependent receptor [Spirochaetia bacterium]
MYIDGIPLNNSQGGEVNLSDLGFDNLEKIEIYKSGLSGGFSNTSIGGTVNLVTNRSDFKKVTRVNIGGGSFNTFKISGFHSDYTEKIRYSFFAQKEKSDQNFIFKSDNGTPVINSYDDRDIRRKNAYFDRYNFTSKLAFNIYSTSVNFLNDFNYRKNGIPGPASNQNEKVEREYIRNTTGISSSTKSFIIDNLSLDTRMFYTGERDHLFDPLQEFSSGTPNSKANLQNYGLHFLPGLSLLNYNQVFKFLISNENETFIRDKRTKLDEIIDKSTKKFRNHTTLQIQDEIRLVDKKIIILPVLQKEIFIDRFNELQTYSDTL